MTHAPGPLAVVKSTPALIQDGGGRIIGQALNPVPSIGLDRVWAYARLFAAAPDLADALEGALLDAYEGWTWKEIVHEIEAKPCMPEWQVAALGALRKAGRPLP